MRRLMPFLAAAALVLSTSVASADLGDQLFKLLPDDGGEDDWFGVSVAFSGSTAIVGAVYDDDNGIHSGSAYLFDTATGQQIAKLLPDDGAEDDLFGISVAISGTTAIIGAYGNDDNGPRSGSAYLFDTTTGQQIAKLLPDDGAENDHFGRSVAIRGTTAIIGAVYDDDNGYHSGSAYVFDISDPASPTQIAKLLPDDGAEADHFGSSVSISDTTAIVAAGWDDDNGDNSGSAYLFDISDPASPTQIAKLLPDDGAEGDRFGSSVAISGTTAIVGAFKDGDSGINSGSAYVFDTTTGQQLFKLLSDDGAAGDYFGFSVAINSSAAMIGTPGNDDNGEWSGSAYLFNAATGQQIAKLLPDDGATIDSFGWSVAINDTIAIIATTADVDNGLLSGAAYLFDVADDADCLEDSDGDGRVTICHIPPGNPDNAHTIIVNVNAAAKHLAHGDHCGPCEDDDGKLLRIGGDAGRDLCPTDLDASGDVGAADLAELLGAWGPNPVHPADLNGDGEVGPADLALVLGNRGPCP